MTDDVTGQLFRENRRLKSAVHDLADAVDELVDELDEQTQGNGPPEHAQASQKRAESVREQTPKAVSEDDKIQPQER